MIDSTGQKLPWMLLLLFLAGIPHLVDAAQPDKTKTQKALPAKEDPGPWLLAGREGECAPLSILAKKGPEYGDIQSPYQLADKLRAAGHKADVKEFKAGTRPSVEVRAPSAGLYVMFVKKEFCDKPAPVPEKK
ncbi:MAG TPA: hypothetical protein VF977_00015 [Candidatus Binatia bacterium]